MTESATAQESVVRTAAERGSFWPCVLVANRGEIAVRVVRTLRKLGIRAAVCYTEADADSPAVQAADVAVAVRGYLDVAAVLEAAQRAGAAAIHPGYGFLSENAEFARACAAAGIVFIGPPPEAITVMGDKITAKQAVAAQGVPTIPGVARAGLNDAELAAAAVELGFPVLVKPAAGGGGKGMRRVVRSDELGQTLASARREAAAAFGDDTLFLERLVARPRHIEMQIVADGHGAVVHLGERECSLQRRHQKVIEEAPSPLVDPGLRERMGAAACAAARSVGYRGAGTVEFLVSEDDPERFYFMEMNTRLQVEHPVTEVVTGIDVVECQLRIAAGEPLGFGQGDVRWTGHAIEARVYAEDPGRGFLPTGGRVLELSEPNGPAVRVDSGLRAGMAVGVDYDPMLSKVIASGPDRAAALAALDRALADTVILGVTTNIEFLRFLLADVDVAAGRLDTELVDRLIGDFHAPEPGGDVFVAAALHRWLGLWNGACREAGDWATPSGWRIGGRAAPVRYRLSVGARTVELALAAGARAGKVAVTVDGGAEQAVAGGRADDGGLVLVDAAGVRRSYRVAAAADAVWVRSDQGVFAVRTAKPPVSARAGVDHGPVAELRSPMPGTVIAAPVAPGAVAEPGATVVIVEAMKMEHALTAPISGVVDLRVQVGDRVQVDQLLAEVKGERS